MIVEKIDFFRMFLSESTLRKYVQLSLKEDMGELDAYLYSNFCAIEMWIDDSFKRNHLVLKLFHQNYLDYFVRVILYLEREKWLEEQMKWYRMRTLEEKACLKLLKSACLYQKKNIDDVVNNNISRLFLLVCSLEELRKRKLMIWNESVIKYDGFIKGFSVSNLTSFDKEETEEELKMVVELSRVLKR